MSKTAKNEAPWSWTPDRRRRVVNMWNKNRTAAEIAASIGPEVTKNMVIGIVTRMGLPPRVNPQSKAYALTKAVLKHARPFNELKTGQCQFAMGESKDKPTLFCSKKVQIKSSFCEVHHKICYQKGSPLK